MWETVRNLYLNVIANWPEALTGLGWTPAICTLFVIAIATILATVLSGRRYRARLEEEHRKIGQAAETQFAEIKGRLAAMWEMAAQRQAEQFRSLDSRLDHVTAALGNNVSEAGRRTSETLSHLNERLALIEDAKKSLAELSSEVVSLQGVLANKQARGAFGQIRMENIVRDALPLGAYEFQAALSNGRRPDCIVRLPNTPAPLVIDSKFPLEGFEALRLARTPDEKKSASKAVRDAVSHHISEIAEKYLIAGETQDTALMFVPSESIYAELHEQFSDLIQKSHRSRVVIVSPNILMLAVQTMQAVIKDVRMRNHAGVIQREVGLLLADVARLADRVAELERHFALSSKALDKISDTTRKISDRGSRLQSVELDEAAE
jgi:DNA recombination protein RmuC